MLVPASSLLLFYRSPTQQQLTENHTSWIPLFLQAPSDIQGIETGTGKCTPRHNKPELTLSIIVLISIIVSYLPQYYRIFQKKSSDGLSLWFLILGSLSTTSSFFNIFVLQWGVVRCCSVIGPGPCTESILGITQLAVQFVMFNLIFILYMIYFPPNKKISTFLRHQLLHCRLFCLPTRSFTWTLSILASKVLLGYFFVSTAITVILLAAVGRGDISHDDGGGGNTRSRAWLLVWAGLLGIIAAFLAMIQYIPQIIETYLRKSMGALSIPMMLIQTPGAILITVSLALHPGANWTTWISYAITALLQIILLGFCLFYAYQIRKRRALRKKEEEQQQQQQEPLLLTRR
ncbi:hypothetical protein EC957_003827 [Mortierella hygrophila]|uniref:PQ loop repeat protein n=1 Tax=Mortierella hygrophila TaxID=979708 RepID=A0A9P6K6L0_9FUNG|nr:hypothetical protein EC957_003827 [Mortierella hygrophila]